MEQNSSSDEESTFETITSFTETPRIETPSSQSEVSSVTTESTITKNESEPEHDEISSKFDMLIEQLGRNKQLPKEMIKFCEGMKEQYLTQQIPDQSNYADVNKLKSLALRYSDLLSSVDNKSRSMEILKKANDELNQYISDMENYHTKQVASLKAKISLNRIESEVRSQTPSQSPSRVGNIAQNKRRRSSILGRFFSRNSGSSLPEISESDVPIDCQEETKRIKEELVNKTITIEELRKRCNEFEQKEKILEAAIHNKNIELSAKNTRMTKLSKNLKSRSDSDAQSVVMLGKLQENVESLNRKMEYTASDMRHSRVKIKENQEKVKKIEYGVYKTNEENKLLLKKINLKSYELINKKSTNNKLVKDVKKYLLSVISLAEQHGKDVMDEEASSKKSPNTNDEEMDTQEQILKRLMRISKTKLSKLFQYKEKLVEETKKKKSNVNQECQTESIAHEQSLLNKKTSEQKVRPEFKKLDAEKRLFHENNDSGLSIAGDVDPMYYHRMATPLRTKNQNYPSNFNIQQSVYRVSNEERNSPGSPGVNRLHYIKPSSSDHYSKDFVDYVEFMKNREIEAYKEDLKRLERDNYQLKVSLDEQNKKVRKLQTDIQYDKVKNRISPSKSYIPPSRLSSSPYDTSPKLRPTLSSPQRSLHAESYSIPPTFEFDDLQAAPISDNFSAPPPINPQNEEELFMESFEKGSQLIQGVFLGRETLERDMELTRQQFQRNKGLRT